MKSLPEKLGLHKLSELKSQLRARLAPFEEQAQNCRECPTPGACCLDAHFVNVIITKLEAVAMHRHIEALDDTQRKAVKIRIDDAVGRFGLRDSEATRTYACPLFEKGVGCLVHDVKPAACMVHACYDSPDDLPPDSILEETEAELIRLDQRVYRRAPIAKSIPVYLQDLERAAVAAEREEFDQRDADDESADMRPVRDTALLGT